MVSTFEVNKVRMYVCLTLKIPQMFKGHLQEIQLAGIIAFKILFT